MTTPRQHLIRKMLVRALAQCGDYPCPESALKAQVEMIVTAPPLTQSEFDQAINTLGTERHAIDGEGATERVWKLTEAGRMWAKEYRA